MIIKREEGQSLVEYSLIIALVAIVAVAALILLGDEIKAIFEQIVSTLGG